jgi:hypothetical protein
MAWTIPQFCCIARFTAKLVRGYNFLQEKTGFN